MCPRKHSPAPRLVHQDWCSWSHLALGVVQAAYPDQAQLMNTWIEECNHVLGDEPETSDALTACETEAAPPQPSSTNGSAYLFQGQLSGGTEASTAGPAHPSDLFREMLAQIMQRAQRASDPDQQNGEDTAAAPDEAMRAMQEGGFASCACQ